MRGADIKIKTDGKLTEHDIMLALLCNVLPAYPKAKKYLIHFTVIVRPERFRRVNETIFCCTAQVFLRMSDQPFYNVNVSSMWHWKPKTRSE